MKYAIIIILGLLVYPFQLLTVRAQTRDTLEYRYPTEIVITASRLPIRLMEIPFSTNLVGQEIMQSLPRAIAIDEPLKLVPGVKVDNQANGSRIHLSIRGQGILTERGIRGIKILQDEIPINDPTGFAPDFFDVDLSTVDRIEVLRGAAASLYGGSASGGIVNITTKNAPDVPLGGEVLGTFGSNGFWKEGAQLGGSYEKTNYRLSVSKTMGDGYREHTHFWGNNVYGKANYTPTPEVKLTPIFSWTDFYHENPEGINLDQYNEDPRQPNGDAIPYNEYLETNRITNGLTGLVLIQNHEINFNGYVKRTLFTEANNHTFNHRTILTPGTSLQYSFSSGQPEEMLRNKISVGTDLQWQRIDESRVDNLHSKEGDTLRSNERIRQRGVGLFAIDKMDLGKQWGFMLSLRYDKIYNELSDLMKTPYDLSGNADFSKTIGRLGVTYYPTEDITLYGNWGQGFLPPATEELAQNPDHFGGFNTHLTSATSNSYELGARGSWRGYVYYDVTGFYMTTDNDFDRYRITDPMRNQETFYRNAGSSRRLGLEFFTEVAPVKELIIKLAYTYSNFKYTSSTPLRVMMDDTTIQKYIVDGNWLPNSPAHQICLDVQYNFMPGLYAGLATETLSKTYIDGANVEAEAADGYTLFHGRVGYHWNLMGLNGDLMLSARNLTDQKYAAFTEPDPGGNAYQPGAGREFFSSLKIQL